MSAKIKDKIEQIIVRLSTERLVDLTSDDLKYLIPYALSWGKKNRSKGYKTIEPFIGSGELSDQTAAVADAIIKKDVKTVKAFDMIIHDILNSLTESYQHSMDEHVDEALYMVDFYDMIGVDFSDSL